ncbi:MAG: hypothetical protein A2Y75_00910 [Candidatus Solincola sediminis]|uniref:Nudix hydrolase domain-containing protein n=1 Tax=Candidatus Solincola sediminis TaxID=1797199 RepID=A0A1F2WKV2_9ACTN|nr:MAG: hypothetical protein A2Y75_00910 [Candidatus Solincola sediminis]
MITDTMSKTMVEPASKFDRIVAGITAVIMNQAGEVLFVRQKRGPYRGQWILPGGSIEYLEKMNDAVKREVLEESGIQVDLLGCFSAYEIIGNRDIGDYHFIMHCYDGRARDKVSRGFQTDEVDSAVFFAPAKFPMHPTDLMIVNDSIMCPFQYPEAEIRAGLQDAGIWMRRL